MASVLVVEDEALTALALVDDLAERGHAVREATDGAAAIVMLRDFTPDVMVTDLTMPHVDGADLIRHVRARGGRRLPIVLVTGIAQDKVPTDLGYDAFFSKPVDHETLGAVVARLAAAG
jgi:two-component system KDP operon response regulator KdpE